MRLQELVQELYTKRAEAMAGGGQTRIDKEHAKGKLTARERLDLLFDRDTFFEVGLFARHRCQDFGLKGRVLPSDGVVTGYGFVNDREVFAFPRMPR